MFSRGWFFALAVVALHAGCPSNECLQSADIQVTVVPDPPIDPAAIARLHVALSVNGSPAKSLVITPMQLIDKSGTAFILHPDATPAASYTITVTIEAMDGSNTLIAIGSDSEKVVSKGCNKLTAHLAGIQVTPTTLFDMSLPPGSDGAAQSRDMFVIGGAPDLAGCGGMPDEDGDGRSNSCDRCPADPDPTPSDSDSDGVPDACDPDVARAGNKLIYFDPFDVASGHWSGNLPTMMSIMVVESTNTVTSANGVDLMPVDVRVQAIVNVPYFWSPANRTDPTIANTGVFLGNGPNPFQPGTNGVLCQLVHDETLTYPDAIQLTQVVNGVPSTGAGKSSTPTGSSCRVMPIPAPCFQFSGDAYRIRLTQRGAVYSCDVDIPNVPGTSLSPTPLTVAQPPAGPMQTMSLQTMSLRAEYHSVVAETALP